VTGIAVSHKEVGAFEPASDSRAKELRRGDKPPRMHPLQPLHSRLLLPRGSPGGGKSTRRSCIAGLPTALRMATSPPLRRGWHSTTHDVDLVRKAG